MRIILSDFISLDGVVPAPCNKSEDTDGGDAAMQVMPILLGGAYRPAAG